ncbi:MAG: hypothetical protein RBT70_09355 [Alphaproteobacteria bacterium]|jgi:hypothetical protein|nr:hypothetical protein [Alphaproteobacteria bacterium]
MGCAAYKILSEVKQAGGSLECVGGDRLRVMAPRPLPPDLVERVKANKPEIILALCAAPVSVDQGPFAERAAIIQANGIPQEWAEGFALLCTRERPAVFTPERWGELLDDGGYFLDAWGRQAAGLRWSAADVFGVNPDAPEWRYDGMGLIPCLNGRRVVAITQDTARIDCGDGASLTFYRHTLSAESITLWDVENDLK